MITDQLAGVVAGKQAAVRQPPARTTQARPILEAGEAALAEPPAGAALARSDLAEGVQGANDRAAEVVAAEGVDRLLGEVAALQASEGHRNKEDAR